MLDPTPPSAPATARDKLLDLLDYVEQVVRLDERVAFDLSDYRLADGRAAVFTLADTGGLPGVVHDTEDELGPVWLAVERLRRDEPPLPPPALAPWIALSSDPDRAAEARRERAVTLDEATRLARIAAGACATHFVPIEREPGTGEAAPPRYTQTLVLAEQPSTQAQVLCWIGETWAAWAAAEGPRRRTIRLYERLYALLQQLETGGAEAPVELVWGIGVVRWRTAGRRIERPLLERLVDLELDEAAAGLIRVRPTAADATADLKPYEEVGVANLALLDEMIRRAIDRASAEDGVSPFRRGSFEAILAAAAARLQPDGVYAPGEEAADPGDTLRIDDGWVLFARPRSNHVVIADIDRLREVTREAAGAVEGLALRLVTEPSSAPSVDWTALSDTLGQSAAPAAPEAPDRAAADVFFPKPFNDDQIAIVHRLARSDGLVVQGPPGTGKTHTIANLICHAMATGQRVLVVSRGEAALAVLREQLPDKVRPLAIALLSNERQGLGQVEAAIREIQGVVEGSRPDVRHAAIRRCEAQIVTTRARIAAIDEELDRLAAAEVSPMGPREELPADLARRIAGERGVHAWFTDRPARYLADTGLTDTDLRDLAAARGRVGPLLDHLVGLPPSPADLPAPAVVAGWHRSLLVAQGLPPPPFVLAAGETAAAETLAAALDGLAAALAALAPHPWLQAAVSRAGSDDAWGSFVAALCADWRAADADRARLLADAVDLPPRLIDDRDARDAVRRGASGERLWPLLSVGKGAAKAHLAGVRVRGAPVREDDGDRWRAVEAGLRLADMERDIDARWRAFAREAGAAGPVGAGELALLAGVLQQREACARALDASSALRIVPPSSKLPDRPEQAAALATQLRSAIEAAGIVSAQAAVARVRALFEAGETRVASIVRAFLDDVLGRGGIEASRIEATWRGLLAQVGVLQERGADFATIDRVAGLIAEAGAPAWAARLRREPAPAGRPDPLAPPGWRDAWDVAAADADLARRGTRERLGALARERAALDGQAQRLFVDLVRERTYYTLDRRLSPSVKSALVEFVRALARLGKGTGRGAGKQRRAAREAMRRCYDAVPCWIMPTWRVAEQLPAALGSFDLVILDEASQSDVTELPALLRGRRILVVGDDRQVSPGTPFVAQAKIDALRRRYLRGLPFQSLFEPGESLYTLMQAVFPQERLMLKEHFRCVEPIIRFSMGFYPEVLLPLRVPSALERLDPPLVDIYVPHGRREKHRRINAAEAAVIVAEIATIAATPGMERRSIGVISLIGGEQAEHIRALLGEKLGAELMQRHAVLCGDSATFQGNERDIVFLSMVADRSRRTALTMLRYAQRFNVAMSRGRDRVVLVRSVGREDLNPADLKARLIQHFAEPMPALPAAGGDPLERCDSAFERAVMERLLGRGYRAVPQVGALGFRIDIVVDGEGGRRLAVECDGDAFHGPERWREDMRRQRVLERVGWRFWRCFASSFYADPDGTLADLFDTLARADIEPQPAAEAADRPNPWVEHRVAPAPPATEPETTEDTGQADLPLPARPPGAGARAIRGAAVGDRIVLVFADDRKPVAMTLTAQQDEAAAGLIAVATPLGQALLGCEEEEEVDLPLATGLRRAVVAGIVRDERR